MFLYQEVKKKLTTETKALSMFHYKVREIIYRSFLASHSDVNFRFFQFADIDIKSSKCEVLYLQMRIEIRIDLFRYLFGRL